MVCLAYFLLMKVYLQITRFSPSQQHARQQCAQNDGPDGSDHGRPPPSTPKPPPPRHNLSHDVPRGRTRLTARRCRNRPVNSPALEVCAPPCARPRPPAASSFVATAGGRRARRFSLAGAANRWFMGLGWPPCSSAREIIAWGPSSEWCAGAGVSGWVAPHRHRQAAPSGQLAGRLADGRTARRLGHGCGVGPRSGRARRRPCIARYCLALTSRFVQESAHGLGGGCARSRSVGALCGAAGGPQPSRRRSRTATGIDKTGRAGRLSQRGAGCL